MKRINPWFALALLWIAAIVFVELNEGPRPPNCSSVTYEGGDCILQMRDGTLAMRKGQ